MWLLGLIYFILLATGFGLTFFVPDLVQERTGYSDFAVGLLAAIPYGVATAVMLWAARAAERRGRRRAFLIVLSLLGAAGTAAHRVRVVAAALTVSITLAAVGLLSAIPLFWALPTAFLSGTAAAAGIALIAAVGNLGGFAGPAFTGVTEDSTGGFETPLTGLALLMVAGSLLTLFARDESLAPPAAPGLEALPASLRERALTPRARPPRRTAARSGRSRAPSPPPRGSPRRWFSISLVAAVAARELRENTSPQCSTRASSSPGGTSSVAKPCASAQAASRGSPESSSSRAAVSPSSSGSNSVPALRGHQADPHLGREQSHAVAAEAQVAARPRTRARRPRTRRPRSRSPGRGRPAPPA